MSNGKRNPTFGNSPSLSRSSNDNKTFVPVRVKDIILATEHSEAEKYGGANAIGVIKYEVVGRNYKYESTEELPAAFPLTSNMRVYPLINEIVNIQTSPGQEIREGETRRINSKQYYTTTVSLWNHPNHNGSPSKDEETLDLGDDVEELANVNPLQPFPGDLVLEGRQGQSIRMSGYKSEKGILTDESNNGKPLMVLSNGQEDVGNGYQPIIENINEDDSSFYLTSDHRVPLTQVTDKYEALVNAPVRADQFKGSQAVINAGRIFFNAKDEDINMSAKNIFSVTAKEAGIDAATSVGLDAEKVYLGGRAKEELQPVILGDSLEGWLNQLLAELKRVGKAMTKAKTVDMKPIPDLNVEGALLVAVVDGLKSQINPGGKSLLKSRKVFTE